MVRLQGRGGGFEEKMTFFPIIYMNDISARTTIVAFIWETDSESILKVLLTGLANGHGK